MPFEIADGVLNASDACGAVLKKDGRGCFVRIFGDRSGVVL